MTTKALLCKDSWELGAFVIHLDATFKLNSVGYPVLITDASRSFHLLANADVCPRVQPREDMTISAQVGLHYARMDVEAQPRTGWPADLRPAYCPCKFHFKMGVLLSFAD